jgi:hypothetical protein
MEHVEDPSEEEYCTPPEIQDKAHDDEIMCKPWLKLKLACTFLLSAWKNVTLPPRYTIYYCSTLSEFANFLLCERILINVTTCQNETSN